MLRCESFEEKPENAGVHGWRWGGGSESDQMWWCWQHDIPDSLKCLAFSLSRSFSFCGAFGGVFLRETVQCIPAHVHGKRDNNTPIRIYARNKYHGKDCLFNHLGFASPFCSMAPCLLLCSVVDFFLTLGSFSSRTSRRKQFSWKVRCVMCTRVFLPQCLVSLSLTHTLLFSFLSFIDSYCGLVRLVRLSRMGPKIFLHPFEYVWCLTMQSWLVHVI